MARYSMTFRSVVTYFTATALTRVDNPTMPPIRLHKLDRGPARGAAVQLMEPDRKSTRLNSSHGYTSYAVLCLKKKLIIVPGWKQVCGNAQNVGTESVL